MTADERRAYYREWYKTRRELAHRKNQCIYCRNTDSRTKRGMNACMKCAIKHSEYSHKSYMKRKEREKERKNQQQ